MIHRSLISYLTRKNKFLWKQLHTSQLPKKNAEVVLLKTTLSDLQKNSGSLEAIFFLKEREVAQNFCTVL